MLQSHCMIFFDSIQCLIFIALHWSWKKFFKVVFFVHLYNIFCIGFEYHVPKYSRKKMKSGIHRVSNWLDLNQQHWKWRQNCRNYDDECTTMRHCMFLDRVPRRFHITAAATGGVRGLLWHPDGGSIRGCGYASGIERGHGRERGSSVDVVNFVAIFKPTERDQVWIPLSGLERENLVWSPCDAGQLGGEVGGVCGRVRRLSRGQWKSVIFRCRAV